MRTLAISIAISCCPAFVVACGGDDNVGTSDTTSPTDTSGDTLTPDGAGDTGQPADTTVTTPDTTTSPPDAEVEDDGEDDVAPDSDDDAEPDSTTGDVDGDDADAGTTPIGGACDGDDDCASGLCLANGTSGVCATACSDAAPCEVAGETCIAATTSAGESSICVDRDDIAGLPCSSDANCAAGSTCVVGEDGVSRCVFACDAGTCDPGYTCTDGLCVPPSGFDCSLFDAASGRVGDCAVTNAFGSCGGVYACNGAGAGSCSAAVPAAEVCDGLDNDCDEQPDDGLCDDDNSCTQDGCDPENLGACKYEALVGERCDDGNACTEDDICDSAAMCGGDSICECETIDDCELPPNMHGDCVTVTCTGTPKVCVFTAANAGAACESAVGCMTDGVCGADGRCMNQLNTCDDGKSCTNDVCNPDGTCSATNKPVGEPCSDNDVCTTGDACVAGGLCIAAGTLDCGDTNACTNNSCNPLTGCVVENNTDPCDDGDDCTLDDVCAGGTCAGEALDCSDLDGDCTTGTCTPGGCVATPRTGSCDDDDPCTTGDRCAAGACGGDPLDCSSLDTACAAGTCEAGSCVAPTTSCTFTARVHSVSVAVDYTPATGEHWLQCSVGHGGPVGPAITDEGHEVIWGFHTVHLLAP